jgi:hypothetical protein
VLSVIPGSLETEEGGILLRIAVKGCERDQPLTAIARRGHHLRSTEASSTQRREEVHSHWSLQRETQPAHPWG